MRYVRIACLLTGFLALVGCTAQPVPYLTPPGLTPQNAASITGSLVKTGSLANNERVYVAEIDNRVTTQNGSSLHVPVLVSPGLHVLQIEACECGGWLATASGSVSVAVNLQPGQSYVTRAGIPASKWIMFDPDKKTSIWLEDSTGKLVTPPQPVILAPPQGPVFMPVFIPAR